MVIGGGLLGLEAARGLLALGLDTTVVHLAEHLMELQLDAEAGRLLRREVERMGIQVLLSTATKSIEGSDRVRAVRFADGSAIPADILVIATGIRPNAELGKECGLAVERGILVDDFMRTSDPNIYAVGECAQHRGRVYGLVEPLYEQGKALAAGLVGDFTKPYRGSTAYAKLKVVGIDLLSIGLRSVEREEDEEIVLDDPARGLYQKIVLREGRLHGAMLLGDLSRADSLVEAVRSAQKVEGDPQRTLFSAMGGADRPAGAARVSDAAIMKDEDTVCGCMGVSKGAIRCAIREHGLKTLDDVRAKTRASTSCGGCAPLVEGLLALELGDAYQGAASEPALCKCFGMPRLAVREAIRERNFRSVPRAIRALTGGDGCVTCRLAVSYILDELWGRRREEDRASRFINDRVHANIQRDGSFSVVPRIYGGVTSPEELRRIADVAEKYQVPMVKITGGQRIDLLGVPKSDLPKIWADLGMPSGHAYTKAVRTCKTCVGTDFCRFGVQDAISTGIEMEKRFQGIPCPHKVKMGVSGCPRNCAEATIKDVGLVGIEGGWEIYVGGNGGMKVRAGDMLARVKTREEAIARAGRFLQYYRENGRHHERTSGFVERLGIEKIRAVLGDPEEGERLLARIDEATAQYADPWLEREAPVHPKQFEELSSEDAPS